MQVLKEVASKVEHPGTRVPGRLARPPPMSFFPFRRGEGWAVCLGASAPKESWGACVWRGEAETRPTVSGWGVVPIFPELSSSVFSLTTTPVACPEYRCLLCREAKHISLGKSPSWSTMEWLGFFQRHYFFSRAAVPSESSRLVGLEKSRLYRSFRRSLRHRARWMT